MAKIDRAEDLPEWFNLDKYQATNTYTAADWLEQLTRRAELLCEQRDIFDKETESSNSERHPLLGSIYWAMVSGQLNDIRDFPAYVQHSSGRELFPAMPVRSVRCLDLFMQAHRDEMAAREGLCNPDKVTRWTAISSRKHPLKSTIAVAGLPIEIDFYSSETSPLPVVQIDLGVSDAVLKEAFSVWLKTARESSQPKITKPSKPLYHRWTRYGLLPYLDLLMWSVETETHIPDRVMSAAISSYDAGEANLRKTVAPLAESLMRDLSELQALAAIEAARSSAEAETFEG